MNKVKQHIKDNKKVYCCGAVAIAAAGITALLMREHNAHACVRGAKAPNVRGAMGEFGRIQTGALSFSLVRNSGNVVTTIHTGKKGHPGFVTRNLETGQIFDKQSSAADAFNIPKAALSGHLNGKFPDVDGYHFERVKVA